MRPHDLNPAGRILVLGAGELGTAVLRSLSRHCATGSFAEVAVLLRPPRIATTEKPTANSLTAARDAALRALGVTIVTADLITDDVDAIAETFGGFDTIVSCVGFAAGVGTQRKITRAVLRAGVKRYLPWQFGVDYDQVGRGSPQPLFDEQLDVRDLLRGQRRTEWIIISTGMFTSFLFDPSFGVVDVATNTVHALGSWDTAVTITTAEDIGVLTAEVLLARPRITDGVVYLAGDTLTYRQLADLLDRVLSVPVHRVEWTVPELLTRLTADPTDTFAKYRAVFAQGRGVAWDKASTFNERHRIPTTTAEQWLRAHLLDSHPA